MACGRNVRWYVESRDGLRVIIEHDELGKHWSHAQFGFRPYLFKKLSEARKTAQDNAGIVRHWNAPKYSAKHDIPF